jgi:hypothetical protein
MNPTYLTPRSLQKLLFKILKQMEPGFVNAYPRPMKIFAPLQKCSEQIWLLHLDCH